MKTNTLERIESVCTFTLFPCFNVQTDSIRAKVYSILGNGVQTDSIRAKVYSILGNGVTRSPKRRDVISLVFTCLCTPSIAVINYYICVQNENKSLELEDR